MTPEAYLNLAGNCVSVAICLYMLNYFMKRDEVRENDIRKIIDNNTKAVEQASRAVDHNTEVISELRNSLSEKISIFEGLKEIVRISRGGDATRQNSN